MVAATSFTDARCTRSYRSGRKKAVQKEKGSALSSFYSFASLAGEAPRQGVRVPVARDANESGYQSRPCIAGAPVEWADQTLH
jgi:hypothetical protein